MKMSNVLLKWLNHEFPSTEHEHNTVLNMKENEANNIYLDTDNFLRNNKARQDTAG